MMMFNSTTDALEAHLPARIRFVIDESARLVELPAYRRITIGRDPITNAEALNLAPFDAARKGVSRQHAEIFPNGSSLTLTDVGSATGTYLNGERVGVNQPVTLHHNDIIRVGEMSLTVWLSR